MKLIQVKNNAHLVFQNFSFLFLSILGPCFRFIVQIQSTPKMAVQHTGLFHSQQLPVAHITVTLTRGRLFREEHIGNEQEECISEPWTDSLEMSEEPTHTCSSSDIEKKFKYHLMRDTSLTSSLTCT